MLIRLLRPHPGLALRFTVASIGRAAMTAASILLTAAIGVAVALGQLVLATTLAVAVTLLLFGAGKLESWRDARDPPEKDEREESPPLRRPSRMGLPPGSS